MTSHALPAVGALVPTIGLALALTLAAPSAGAGQASTLFRVTVELITAGSTPAGVGCRSPAENSLECGPRPVVAGTAAGNTRVILYGSSLIEDEGRMWGAVAASRRVTWAGRDYLELTLSW